MDNLEKRLARAQLVNQWAQIIGIAIAGVWTYILFVHKEIIQPAAVPVNVAIELSLSPMAATSLVHGSADVIPLELKMSVKNPSTRQVALLSSVFVVSGSNFDPANAAFDGQPTKNQSLKDTGRFPQRHAGSVNRTLVAIGDAFPDDILKPNETLTRQVVVYVPIGKYDCVRARVHVPSARFEKRLEVEWTLMPDSDITRLVLYELKPSGRVLVKSVDDQYEVDEELDLQRAKSAVEVALPRPISTIGSTSKL
jgi:hypothetical protein